MGRPSTRVAARGVTGDVEAAPRVSHSWQRDARPSVAVVPVTRRGAILGGIASATLARIGPAVAATELGARPVSGMDAYVSLMDGRDAVRAAGLQRHRPCRC